MNTNSQRDYSASTTQRHLPASLQRQIDDYTNDVRQEKRLKVKGKRGRRKAIQDPDSFSKLHKEEVMKSQYDTRTTMDHTNNMIGIRIMVCLTLILGIIYNIQPNMKDEQTMRPGECMRDYTFIWTAQANQWLIQNEVIKNRYMIYAGFLMDLTQMIALVIFFLRFGTYRVFVALIFFMSVRAFIMNNFLMGRPSGFAWFNPGMPALTVPYHDTNDFYYSGHIGTSTIYMIEFFAQGYTLLGFSTIFVLVNQWILLMLLRTHYIIDLVTGLLLGHWA